MPTAAVIVPRSRLRDRGTASRLWPTGPPAGVGVGWRIVRGRSAARGGSQRARRSRTAPAAPPRTRVPGPANAPAATRLRAISRSRADREQRPPWRRQTGRRGAPPVAVATGHSAATHRRRGRRRGELPTRRDRAARNRLRLRPGTQAGSHLLLDHRFGQTGPYHSRPGYDIIAQGVTGFLRMTEHPDGRPAKTGIAAWPR